MEIVGYANEFSVRAGETIQFMVSCRQADYSAAVVRLIHGDVNPLGPGFKEKLVQELGTFPGQLQELRTGSYGIVPDHPLLRFTGSFTLMAWVYSTTPETRAQSILSKWSEATSSGYALTLDGDAGLTLKLGFGSRGVERISTGVKLRRHFWYFVAACFDASTRQVTLYQRPHTMWPLDDTSVVIERQVTTSAVAETDVPLIIAGHWQGQGATGPRIGGLFNGKIEGPTILGRALNGEQVEAYRSGSVQDFGTDLIADWHFGRDFSSDLITDRSTNHFDGHVVNRPTRAMKSHNWTANYMDFTRAPEEYAAIHFHDDDLDDAKWEVSFEYAVPDDLKSGVYAAHITTAESREDYVPFFVRPGAGASLAKILLLLPTHSYLAYANCHHGERTRQGMIRLAPSTPQDDFIMANHLNSCYDNHTDDSKVFHSSRLRPIVTMRPKYNYSFPRLNRGGPWQFNADLHLVDWLDEQGYDYDVATDEDVQREGANVFQPYNVVLTGSHPEYWSQRGLDSLETYLRGGGRLMYLGGNGFWSVVSLPPDSTHCIEMRRRAAKGNSTGAGPWGEWYHSNTGEPGSNWRVRGRSERSLVGVGPCSMGFDYSMPYRRMPGSFDPRAVFIFQGIGDDEIIGNFGLKQDGACGYEIDSADYEQGTPPHALVLMSCTEFGPDYVQFEEEDYDPEYRPRSIGRDRVRGDVVYFEGPDGGAVFSVGSISWCGSLSHNHYENNVSRITKNVLDRFSS